MESVIEGYKWEEIHKVLGKINNQIESFRQLYHRKPTLIIISESLEYILECSINEKGHINVSLSSEEVGKLLDILNEALE